MKIEDKIVFSGSGKSGAARLIGDIHEVELQAEIGLDELKPVRKIALTGAPVQILLTNGVGFRIGRYTGLPLASGLVRGPHISFQHNGDTEDFHEQGLMGTLSSRVMIGMLIVQDLAVIPMMIILPQLSDHGAGLPLLAGAAIRSAVFLTEMLFMGKKHLLLAIHQAGALRGEKHRGKNTV